jgi:hypothetical protein
MKKLGMLALAGAVAAFAAQQAPEVRRYLKVRQM